MTSLRFQARDWTKRLVRERLQAVRPPHLKHGGSGRQHIYYLCPDHARPSGGVRAIYRHVDILNCSGLEASVLHKRRGFACDWFSHSTRVASARDVVIGTSDTLVVPEIYAGSVGSLPTEARLICFNQNAYLTFTGWPAAEEPHYARFQATMVVSRDNLRYLSSAFPHSRLHLVPNSIDSSVFFPADAPPQRRISVMPNKRKEDWLQIKHLLAHRLCPGWEIDVIAGVSEAEAARRLRGSSVFIALGRQEGFGLPVAEALASGCRVVGFHGYGGRELFRREFSTAIEDGDVVGVVEEVVRATELFESDPGAFAETGRDAARWVASAYTPEQQTRGLLALWESADG